MIPPTTVATLGHALADALSPLLRDLVSDEVAKQVARLCPPRIEPRPAPTGKRTLTYRETHDRYGIGRVEWKRLILTGTLGATSRRMRGGREGWVVAVEEAERVLGGKAAA